jgi:hypothetical protein
MCKLADQPQIPQATPQPSSLPTTLTTGKGLGMTVTLLHYPSTWEDLNWTYWYALIAEQGCRHTGSLKLLPHTDTKDRVLEQHHKVHRYLRDCRMKTTRCISWHICTQLEWWCHLTPVQNGIHHIRYITDTGCRGSCTNDIPLLAPHWAIYSERQKQQH